MEERLRTLLKQRDALDAEIRALQSSTEGTALELQVANLRSRVEALEQQREPHMSHRRCEDSAVVRINVGGTVFSTLRSTLVAFPSSLLAAMVGANNVARDSEGNIFVDRDPRTFEAILAFLRGEPLSPDEMRRFSAAADYFGLPRVESPFVVTEVRLVRTLHAHTNLWALDARGDLVVAGGKIGLLWRINGTVLGELVGHAMPILCVKISPALDLIATGSEDSTVRLWSVKTLECVHVLRGHQLSVCTVDVADGIVCSASADWAIRVWKLETGELLRVLSATEPVFCVRIDGDSIVCGGEKAIREFFFFFVASVCF